jgi:hypothetical protein
MSDILYKNYKIAKMNLVDKYSKKVERLRRANSNLDSFISINDFLANEQSLGPNADPGEISYEYTKIENIINYSKILINELKFNKVVCLTSFAVTYGNKYIAENAIVYNSTRDELLIPMKLIKELKKCKTNRFIYVYLTIIWELSSNGHANMIIIDQVNKTIERYEPHGQYMMLDKKKKILKGIDSKFNDKLLSYIGLKKYTYISPIDISPKLGPQAKADAYDGMCVTYSMMYLQLRIMNPDIDQKEIIKYLVKKPRAELYDILLRYARYIEDKLKENTSQVVKNQNILYNVIATKIEDFIIVNKRNDIDLITY